MTDPFDPLHFSNGLRMKNRFMLAPLTNLQSHDDGTLSDDEYRWLTFRARGGFGMTMTCASHVQETGRGFPGQLGCFGDQHLDGLSRLASGIRKHDSIAMLQLHHAGMRSPADLIGTTPVCPSENTKHGARALSLAEVEQMVEDFIAAAVRAQSAGFDGVEVHGAHGYVLCQFLSPTINQRDDDYGGSIENRARIIFDVVDGIRDRCGPEFLLGVRLSPERFDVRLDEIRWLAERLMRDATVNFIDMSLWDTLKEPEEEAFKGRTLMSYFTELDRGDVRLGVAGKLRRPADVSRALSDGADFAILGRAGILHHDYPNQVKANADFEPMKPPVSADYLREQGLGEALIDYVRNWNFVE